MSGIFHNAVSMSAESPSSHPRPLLYLTALLVSLATCAFLLQWHGGLPDPYIDGYSFPGMGLSERDELPASSDDCAEILGRSKMLSFPYYSWRPSSGSGLSDNALKICITSTTSAGLEQILPWILYHKVIGATQFLLFVEYKAASNNVTRVLESIPEVRLVYRTQELEEQQAKSISNESWLAFSFNKPCNFELFTKQTLNMETAIAMAREAGMDWIIHIDTDELLHPAGTLNYSVQELLSELPHNIDMVKFPAYESCVERDDIKEPFSEVSMFKKNHEHLLEETYIKHYLKVARGNPNYTLAYASWKSGARIQDGLISNGAHEWWNSREEFNTQTVLEEAAILHCTYSKFSDLKSRRNRCKCKLTREDVKRCIMLEFDRNAFIIASTSTEEEMLDWYNEHIVWYDTEVKAILLHEGVLERIYAPMVIVQGLKESGIFADIIASAWRKHELNQKS